MRSLIGRCGLRSSPRTPARCWRRRFRKAAPIFWLSSFAFAGTAAHAADPKPETLAAFHRYVAAAEAQEDDPGPTQFLFIDSLPDAERQKAYEQLRGGEAYIEEMHTEEDHHPIPIPGGLVHHWAGIIFIPGGTVSGVDSVLHDYSRQSQIYKSDVQESRLIEQDGDHSKVFERFYSKSIVTVVLDVYFDVAVTRLGSTRLESVSRSTRIAEVADFGTPQEHERTDGKDHGYMWRLNSYWRLEQKDGGVYAQIESISLSRTVPVLLAWVVNPLTKSIPREVLSRTLTNTRKAVQTLQAPRP